MLGTRMRRVRTLVAGEIHRNGLTYLPQDLPRLQSLTATIMKHGDLSLTQSMESLQKFMNLRSVSITLRFDDTDFNKEVTIPELQFVESLRISVEEGVGRDVADSLNFHVVLNSMPRIAIFAIEGDCDYTLSLGDNWNANGLLREISTNDINCTYNNEDDDIIVENIIHPSKILRNCANRLSKLNMERCHDQKTMDAICGLAALESLSLRHIDDTVTFERLGELQKLQFLHIPTPPHPKLLTSIMTLPHLATIGISAPYVSNLKSLLPLLRTDHPTLKYVSIELIKHSRISVGELLILMLLNPYDNPTQSDGRPFYNAYISCESGTWKWVVQYS